MKLHQELAEINRQYLVEGKYRQPGMLFQKLSEVREKYERVIEPEAILLTK